MNSFKDSFSKSDFQELFNQSLIFSSPAIIAFLVALEGGADFKIALGMLIKAGIDILINALRKYSAGVEKVTPTV